MKPIRTERHPGAYRWHERFPDARRLQTTEGEAVFMAQGEGAWWVISDSGTLADFAPEDRGDLTRLDAFASEEDATRYFGLATSGWTAEVARMMLGRGGPAIARRLEQVAREKGLTRINERDHLQPAAAAILKATHPLYALPIGATENEAHGLGEEWPRLGKVDIALGRPPLLPAFVELKCAELGPCAWDVLKLAFCLRRERASAGFLMAAAPAEVWSSRALGAALFESSGWTAESLRGDFAKWWPFWEKDGATEERPEGYRPPARVPSSFATARFGEPSRFVIGPTRWELRIAEVTAEGDGWFEWSSLRT